MRLRAVYSPGRLLRRLRAADSMLREAAADAAADALKDELRRAGGNAIAVQPQGARRAVGSNDPRDAVREFGTQTQIPSPWLAPALPTALEPMRAAADATVARAFFKLAKQKR